MGNRIKKDIPSKQSISFFRKKLLQWYPKNRRMYPWRETSDPFRVLIAEVMLRRTRADQVKQVYQELFSKYSDVSSLASAKEKKLEKILCHLGLNWRIPVFSQIARELRDRYKCIVPDSRDELKSLPGVGDYVAGAVLSIAFGQNEWIVDSNIVRVFKHYFGIETSKEGRRDRHVIEIARGYSSGRKPRKANLAILDFSALVCSPRKPHCYRCTLRNKCRYM